VNVFNVPGIDEYHEIDQWWDVLIRYISRQVKTKSPGENRASLPICLAPETDT
jgi:hypothetical protein